MAATAGTWIVQSYGDMQYRVLLPDGYSPNGHYPVLLFLHGGGQQSQLPGLLDPWFNTPEFRTSYPAIVVAPQLRNSSMNINWGGYPYGDSSGEDKALAIVQQVKANYATDENRVYVTGLSLGGHSAWDLMIKDNAYNGLQGRVFAAALPLAGYESAPNYSTLLYNGYSSVPTQAVVDQLRNVPIWAVQGTYDAPEFDRAFAAAAPTGAYRYTELPLGHDVWDTTYPLPNGKPYYDWLFSQSASQTPAVSAGGAVTPTPPIPVPDQVVHERQIARLYTAALGRPADSAGLVALYRAYQSGLTLAQIADALIGSTEFAGRYGTPSDTAFVSNLYQNALGRPGDDAGVKQYAAALQAGTDRGAIVAAFSESGEAQAHSLATFDTAYAATAEAQVARAYDTAFGRTPDASGGAQYASAIISGFTLQQAAASFLASPEFTRRYGTAPSDLTLVDAFYVNTLHRPADAAGEAQYLRALGSGQFSRTDLFVAFSESGEHINLLTQQV